jgi:hypothetical protein
VLGVLSAEGSDLGWMCYRATRRMNAVASKVVTAIRAAVSAAGDRTVAASSYTSGTSGCRARGTT